MVLVPKVTVLLAAGIPHVHRDNTVGEHRPWKRLRAIRFLTSSPAVFIGEEIEDANACAEANHELGSTGMVSQDTLIPTL